MDQEVPIYLEQAAVMPRRGEPVRIGVPLPKGFAEDVSLLRLKNEVGLKLSLQSRPLAFWPDRTIKWVLLDFIASTQGSLRTTYRLGRVGGEENAQVATPGFLIREQDGSLVIDTGAAQFHVPRKCFGPFSMVTVGGIPILSGTGSRVRLADQSGREYQPEVDLIIEEENGPVRLTLRIEGRFVGRRQKALCLFKARLIFYHGQSTVRIEFQIHNPRAAVHPGGLWDLGDRGSIHFQDLSLVLQASESPQSIIWATGDNERIWEQRESEWLLYQDSSGGDNWNSPNHFDKDGELTVSFRGYRVGLDKGGLKSALTSGDRATPYVQVNTSSGWMATTVVDFWQGFPKALQVKDKELRVAIFPDESGAAFELQGGEKKRHAILLDFGAEVKQAAIGQLQQPLHVNLDPAWIEKTGAVSYFLPQCDDVNSRYINYIKKVVGGPGSFFGKRELVDEYGWRNFGDLYADHEAVKHEGLCPLVSHYNNQYDFIYGALVQFLASGDRRWYELMDDAARHTIDIDIYHTDEDRPAYNHGLFWHTDHYRDAVTCTHRTYSRKNGGGRNNGGGPSNEHNYTSGLLHYYYLTGDPEAAAAVQVLADWVISMDDGSQSLLGLIDEGAIGAASSTVDPLYHKPGRGAGNSINVLIDAYMLSNDRNYMKKAEELIERCIHPTDDIDALKLNHDPEHRWSYLVFLQAIGKYLDSKVELNERDYSFYYARDSLLHFADWMMEHEVPYKDVLYKVEIPTETWPAHDIRKCWVFHLAEKYGHPDRRNRYSDKAQYFFDRCLTDLLSFETAFLTRPLVILTVFGYINAYFQKHRDISVDYVQHGYGFGDPISFLPQKTRIRGAIKRKLDLIAQTVRRIAVSEFYRVQSGFHKKC
jgi:hypothetical protein